MQATFRDRNAAGEQLAEKLRDETQPVVLGIARGGVLVAAPVARALRAPLDVCVIRKIGHPAQPELAMGAVSAAGDVVFTDHARDVSQPQLDLRVVDAQNHARALESRLRGDRAALDVRGRTVILIDDGIATSATMLCAIEYARGRGAARVVCAVPVAPGDFLERLRVKSDRLVVLVPAFEWHFAVGRYYADFSEVTDEEVRAALAGEGGAR
ncbi:MAG: phosphoribosyltransferase [Candidatus Eremiobacteraeota bacterium]|nr:phosphoribosyltransferase [Candidatus Eremiobacteraeota bacterium]